jgi:two-component system response regulator
MKSNKIIVLIEDNEQDEHLTIRALKKNNILNEIVVLRDGQEAMQFFADKNETREIQVILLDIKLPKIDGLEILKFVRATERIKNTPVVMLTTSNEESDILRGYDLGANSYVRKPVDFDEFAAAVKQLGLYWLILNLPPKK